MLIAVDSFEEESAEIPYAELVKDDYAEVSKKKLQILLEKVLQLVMLQEGNLF